MKKQKIGIVVITLAIVGLGGLLFSFSTNKIMADMQGNLSEERELVSNEQQELEESLSEYQEKLENLAEQLQLKLQLIEEMSVEIQGRIATTSFVYYGQNVHVKDGLLEEDIAKENGIKIMDFIFDYVDQKIFTLYEIDKTAYTYEIQRQYQEKDGIHYGVFMKQQDRIICTIGIDLNDEPVLTSFARDGLVDLCGGEKEIPESYLVKKWCNTEAKKEAIYNEYYDSSKDVIENVLGLSPIKEEKIDVNNKKYFSADDDWSAVVFGYELEDGTYIRVFYNRVNQMWDGFVLE